VGLFKSFSWWRRGVSNRGERNGESKFLRMLDGSYAYGGELMAVSGASGRGGRAARYGDAAA